MRQTPVCNHFENDNPEVTSFSAADKNKTYIVSQQAWDYGDRLLDIAIRVYDYDNPTIGWVMVWESLYIEEDDTTVSSLDGIPVDVGRIGVRRDDYLVRQIWKRLVNDFSTTLNDLLTLKVL